MCLYVFICFALQTLLYKNPHLGKILSVDSDPERLKQGLKFRFCEDHRDAKAGAPSTSL